MKAMKVSHFAKKCEKVLNGNPFEDYIGSDKNRRRLVERIMKGRKVKPCGRECYEYGKLIAESYNHSSFENFSELMNDSDFLLDMAKITPNPVMCESYFYEFINDYLKRDGKFRLQFLKNVYLNVNVFKKVDIDWVVNTYELEKENEILLTDFHCIQAEITKKRI